MDRYKVVILWSEGDQAYLAEMPELPGCMADDATQEQALQIVRETAHLWMQTAQEIGRPIPAPDTSEFMLRAG